MGKFRIRRTDYSLKVKDGRRSLYLRGEVFSRFSHSILGLGDVSKPAKGIEAICAVFDLEGFTRFCGQVDPHLAVPEFMTQYLEWLFATINSETAVDDVGHNDDDVKVYCRLPFFAKFMGDGVMFLWDTVGLSEFATFNIPIAMGSICKAYTMTFLPNIRRHVSDPPDRLRVGVARGRVLSVGDSADFVGPAINIAARLQKLAPGITFAFSRRGFNAEKSASKATLAKLVLKDVAIRGIGEHELVYVRRDEFESLAVTDKSTFRDV